MTTAAYKLLRPDLTTYDRVPWLVGQWRETSGRGKLCGPGWLHAYASAEIAWFLNPIHANYASAVLYQVEGAGAVQHDHGIKIGYTRMRLVAPVAQPIPTTEQRVRFGLACAYAVYREPTYQDWAGGWLCGEDRSAGAAEAAAEAAVGAARAAAWAAVGAAGAAAKAAAEAARAAAEAAGAAAWAAAEAAAGAARAAAWAAAGAARAAAEAARADAWAAAGAAAWAAAGAARAAGAAAEAAAGAAWAEAGAALALRRAAQWAMSDSTTLPRLLKRAP